MRPFRSGLGQFFPPVRSTAAKLAIALVASSVLCALSSDLRAFLLLTPADVLQRLMLWQPLTYVPIATTPMEVIFGALITWSIGGALEVTWGSSRLWKFALGVPAVAGVLTVLVSFFVPIVGVRPFAGAAVMTSSVWVAYGLAHGRAQTQFWGIPVSGNVFALIGAGFVLLVGIFGNWLSIIPELIGLALTWGYMRAESPRRWFLRIQGWRLQRQLKGRSKHLKLISKNRNMPSDSDRFLH